MYFCRNCGEPFWDDTAVKCEKCDAPKNSGNTYCYNCGNPVVEGESVCQVCGVSISSYYTANRSAGFNGFNTDSFGANDYDKNTYNTNTYETYETYGTVAKSKIAAGLLGIFCGGLGIHNFYLGYSKKAVTQMVLTIVGYCLYCIGIGAIITTIVHIWGFVEGIMILTGKIDVDGNGQRLIG